MALRSGTDGNGFFRLLGAPQPRELSLAGARILAQQLCGAVDRRHAVAVSRVEQSQACPIDLHALLPVPAHILALGPDEPEALAWLWEHWGTTEALRHVAVEPTREQELQNVTDYSAPAEGRKNTQLTAPRVSSPSTPDCGRSLRQTSAHGFLHDARTHNLSDAPSSVSDG